MRKCSKPDGNKNWVGKRIAELRKDRGMSQNDLAIKLQNMVLILIRMLCNCWSMDTAMYGIWSCM